MENAIWTTIYDFPKEGRDEYLTWLHEKHIPEALSRKGYLWAAHFQLMPNKHQSKVGRSKASAIPVETGFAIFFGGESTRTFLNPGPTQFEKGYTGKTREMIGRRIRPMTYVHTVEWHTEGPESGRGGPTGMPGPFIQMGLFDASGQDEDLGTWYVQERMALWSRTPGCVRGRKLLATVGPERHSVLYDFTSLELRKQYFPALNSTEWSLRLHPYLVHPPGSSFLGKRIWPPE